MACDYHAGNRTRRRWATRTQEVVELRKALKEIKRQSRADLDPQVSEYLLTAKKAAIAAGGLDTPAGEAAFEASLVARFATNYNSKSTTIWTGVPSDPNAETLFRTSTTYTP